MIKKILTILFILISFSFFYIVNDNNYEKHNEIKKNLINHPENLPKKDFAKASSFGFQNLKADYYWLKTIQYIGGNAYHSEYKAYLMQILDLVTDLNPYFESPYIIGQLLLPAYEPRYEFIGIEEQEKHTNEAIELGLKGIKNFCNSEKMLMIENENDITKVWNNSEYSNPCLSYKIPFYLAYSYFFYKHNPLEAAKYYKIASANKDAPSGAKVMSGIMLGKGGDREKSYFMFLTLSSLMGGDKELCEFMNKELERIGKGIFVSKDIPLNGNTIKYIDNLRNEAFGKYDEEDNLLKDIECSNYINKSIRELNLYYLEEANKNFIKDKGKTSHVPMNLYNSGYINYIPTDFQQYDEYGIIYIYNENTGNYDYILGNY